MRVLRCDSGCCGPALFLLASLAALPACGTPGLPLTKGRVTHAEVGFSIAIPEGGPSVWEQASPRKRALTFTAKRGRTLSLLWRCGRRPVSDRLLARRLLGRLDGTEILAGGAEERAGGAGWLQRVQVEDQGRNAHLLSFSRRAADCDWDFLLVTPRRDVEAETLFLLWVDSFVPPRGTS